MPSAPFADVMSSLKRKRKDSGAYSPQSVSGHTDYRPGASSGSRKRQRTSSAAANEQGSTQRRPTKRRRKSNTVQPVLTTPQQPVLTPSHNRPIDITHMPNVVKLNEILHDLDKIVALAVDKKKIHCPFKDCARISASKGDMARHLQSASHCGEYRRWACYAHNETFTRDDACKRHFQSKGCFDQHVEIVDGIDELPDEDVQISECRTHGHDINTGSRSAFDLFPNELHDWYTGEAVKPVEGGAHSLE